MQRLSLLLFSLTRSKKISVLNLQRRWWAAPRMEVLNMAVPRRNSAFTVAAQTALLVKQRPVNVLFDARSQGHPLCLPVVVFLLLERDERGRFRVLGNVLHSG